jgi:anti-sigma B factor antagonist
MNEPVVTMDVRQVAPDVSIIDITGEVTAACEGALTKAHENAATPSTTRIILNFTGLNYMNSGGIGMIVTLLVRANRQHQQLAAYGLSSHYRQIFELTRLDEAITIYDDEARALAGSAS